MGRRPKRGFTNEEAAKAAAKMDQPEPPPKAPMAAPAAQPKEEKKTTAPATGGALSKDPNTAPPPDKAAKAAKVGIAPGMSDDEIKKMIMKHEGFSLRPYRDSLGLWTVGVGHLIGDGKTLPPEWDREFSQEEVMALFDKDYQEHKAAAAANTPNFDQMTGAGKGAFTDLTFNMGPNWLSRWPNTKKAIEEQNNMAIAMGLQNSKWFNQVGTRAPTIVDLVKSAFPMAADGGVFDQPVIAGEAGPEAIIPLKNGSIPITFPKEFVQFAEKMAKVDSLTDMVKTSGVGAASNLSEQFKTALEEIRESAKSAAGAQFESFLEEYKRQQEAMRAEAAQQNDDLLRALSEGNSISNKMLAATM